MASRKFLVPANLLNLTEDPASGESGDIYFNTTSDKLKIYDGSAWVEVGSGGGSAITVSDTAPASPTSGDAWYDNTTGSFYVYDGTFWVEVNGVVASESFKTISVSGQSDIVADTTTDTLTFVAGTNVSITTNATNDSVTINSTGDYTSVDSITYPDYITFDTTPETIPTAQGSLWWNSDKETLDLQLDSGVILNVGQDHVIRAKNDSGSVAIPKMTVVMFAGSTGDTVEVSPAISTATYEPELLVGITAEEIPADGFGFVTQFGFVNKVNTSTPGWSLGDLLYVDAANPGLLTNVKPSAPNWNFPIAAVTRVHATTGKILVRTIPGKHLHDLVDVLINTEAEDQILRYDAVAGLWKNTHPNIITAKNAEESTVSAFTPVYINSETLGLSQVTFLKADANIISKMPATGITISSVASEAFSKILTQGVVSGITLTGYSDGDLLYVANGGGFTKTRPTGDDYIQPFGRVLSVDNGSIYVFGNTFVSSIDSLPNLASDKIWLGTSGRPVETTLNTTVVSEGTNLYFTDERAQDAAAELFTSGVHTGASVEYNDSTGKVNITNTGVTSITGTTNEIAVSGSTGGVTISIPDSPVFVTPDIGVATATSINGTTIPTSETLLVSGDLSDYAPIVNPVFTSNIEVNGQIKFDVVGGTPGAFINFATIPETYSSLDIISTDIIFLQASGDMSISSSNNVVISGTNGEYLNSATTNNQIATIGDLSSFITSETDPVFTASEAYNITSTDTGNWDTAFGWGNHASAGYLTSEADTFETVTDRGATSSNAITISNATQSTTPTSGALIISGGVGIAKDVWIDGDLHVNGTTITENTQTVATHDNMIYLNAAQDTTITNAVGDGTYVTYTADNAYTPGMDIRVTGMDPSGYNISSADGLTVYSATSTQFVVAKTTTGSFVSGGTAHAKEEANPDLGFAGGYYNAGYAHAGLFRDASDGIFKVFDGYTPEPDEAVNIDTTHASFSFAPIKVESLDVVDAATTRTNLGLAIGTDIQQYSPTLAAVAGGTYTGELSITTLGTVSFGTWNATTIGYAYGGTGLTTLGTAGQVLTVNSGATALEWTTPSGGGGGGLTTSTTSIMSDSAVEIAYLFGTNKVAEAIIHVVQGTYKYASKIFINGSDTSNEMITEYAILDASNGAIPLSFSYSGGSLYITITNGAFNNADVSVVLLEVDA